MMEYLNKIELQSYITNISFSYFPDGRVGRFAIAIQDSYKNDKGTLVVETTWFDCTARDSAGDFSELQVGDWVHIVGRVKERRFIDKDGTERRIYQVICKTFNIVAK